MEMEDGKFNKKSFSQLNLGQESKPKKIYKPSLSLTNVVIRK